VALFTAALFAAAALAGVLADFDFFPPVFAAVLEAFLALVFLTISFVALSPVLR
jgi:hypothetical protein